MTTREGHSYGLAAMLAAVVEGLGPTGASVTAIHNIWLVTLDAEPGDTLVYVRQQALAPEPATACLHDALAFCDAHALVPGAFLFSTADDSAADRAALCQVIDDLADECLLLSSVVYADVDGNALRDDVAVAVANDGLELLVVERGESQEQQGQPLG